MSESAPLTVMARNRRMQAMEQRAVQRDLKGEAPPEPAAPRRNLQAISPFSGAKIRRLAASHKDLRAIFREEEAPRIITAPPGPVRSLPAGAEIRAAGGEPGLTGASHAGYSPRPRNTAANLLLQVRQ